MAFQMAVAAPASTSFGLAAAPLTTSLAAGALELRADASSSTASATATATATTSGVAALTTTFTPPASCASDYLTMLTAVNYQIWLNEPEPLANSLMTACYPSQWIDNYSSPAGSSSSVVPVMSPLVCPSGWNTQSEDSWSSGYMACCASGYTLAKPSSTVDKKRPAYGGTCYSNFDLDQVATVTVYNESALSTTSAWTATTTPAQAYAHPIDGYAADYTPSSSSSSSGSSGETGSGTASGSSSSETATSTSTGGSGSDSGAGKIGRNELVRGAAIALFVTAVIGCLL